jgi:hypothetical protein
MTTTSDQATPITPEQRIAQITAPADDPKMRELVVQGMRQIDKRKMSLADLFDAISPKRAEVVDKTPPAPPALTEAVLDALRRLPDLYGKVVVHSDRKLTKTEAKAIVEERDAINTVLGVLKSRKEESIRDTLANHLDHVLTDEQRQGARTGKRGDYAVKQEEVIEGTGRKIQRSVAGGKPNLSIQAIERLHAEGLIDRPTYLKITRKPDLPRVIDEAGLHQAIQKDPRLFFLLGSVAEPTVPQTTITVVDDK